VTRGEPTDSSGGGPVLRVVRGRPEASEVAALVAVVLSRANAPSSGRDAQRVSVWASRARLVRPPLRPGRAAWRTSGWPR
jgi:hypothetical protein